jgi:hypothetical protein
MVISFKIKAMNKGNSNKVLLFLFLIIGLCAFSLYLSTIMVNAQLSPNSTSNSNSTTNEPFVFNFIVYLKFLQIALFKQLLSISKMQPEKGQDGAQHPVKICQNPTPNARIMQTRNCLLRLL